jgi:hypothetical protein
MDDFLFKQVSLDDFISSDQAFDYGQRKLEALDIFDGLLFLNIVKGIQVCHNIRNNPICKFILSAIDLKGSIALR